MFDVSIIKMWSFLKHYDGAQLGKRKTASATPAENMIERLHKEIELEIGRTS
jgi:hypothetical protein